MRNSQCLLVFSFLILTGCGTSTVTNDTANSTSAADDKNATSAAEANVSDEPVPSTVAATPNEQLGTIQREFKEEYDIFLKAYRSAKDDTAKQAAMDLMPKTADYGARFKELAAAHPDTEAAVDALVWVSSNLRGREGDDANRKLFESYSSNPKIAPVVMMMKYNRGTETEGLLRDLIKSNETDVLQAAARYALGSILIEQDHQSEEAIGLLQSVVDDYPDAEISFGHRSMAIAPQAQGELTEATKLQVGMVAPDIEGADLDGVEFKLSDYRGKVVVLDFWGNW